MRIVIHHNPFAHIHEQVGHEIQVHPAASLQFPLIFLFRQQIILLLLRNIIRINNIRGFAEPFHHADSRMQ